MRNKWIKEEPTIKQLIFLSCPYPEVLFGGSAGGGKTSASLMAALLFVDVPGYTAMLFRKTYADLALPGAIMDRAAEWLGPTEARWSAQEKRWTFPSGATVGFGYLDAANDHYRYQGMEIQACFFDELTQFPENHYLYLFSRLRRLKDSNVPLRMRAASNPGGVGHGWVRDRFLTSPGPDRVFIPSKLDDNPHLDRDEYKKSLMHLDPFTRAQLLEGDWSEYTGGLFRRDWFQVVDDTPAEMDRVRAWDLAATEVKPGTDPDWTVGVRMGKHRSGVYYVEDVIRTRASPRAVEALVRQTADLDGIAVRIVMEQEPGSSGVGLIDHYQRNVLAGYAFSGERPTGDKVARAQAFSSAAEAGNVKLKRGEWCRAFLEELCLAKDTKITTINGDVFIQDVVPGDWVATRRGWKRVLKSHQTGENARVCEVQTGDGGSITVTPNHPILVLGFGFKKAGLLKAGDALLRFTGGSYFFRIRIPKTDISVPMPVGIIATSIGIFGNPKSGRSQKGTTSITKMETQETTPFPICDACQRRSILRTTGKHSRSQFRNRRYALCAKNNTGQCIADEPRHAVSYVPRDASLSLETRIFMGEPVQSVVNSSSRPILKPLFAASSVLPKSSMNTEGCRKSHADGVGSNFGRSFQRKFFAAKAVVSAIAMRSSGMPVYNLEVEDCHEFVANGILVHNCVFPHGAHDDEPDAASLAFNKLAIPKKWKRLGVRDL